MSPRDPGEGIGIRHGVIPPAPGDAGFSSAFLPIGEGPQVVDGGPELCIAGIG